MFNKGKPYVPPPTRSMGSAHPHDDLHDIDDELELELDAEIPADDEPITGPNAFSHAAEERGTEEPIYAPAPDPEPEAPVETPQAAYTPASNSHTAASPFASSSSETTTGGSGSGGFGGGSGGGWGSGSGGGSVPPSRPTREASSVLGNGMTFEGDISGVGQLVIEGTVKGDVRVSNVLINENGSVEGTVHADVLEVRGRVTGAIIAKQVHLHASSRVEGDITQEQLTVDRGAWFSGRSTQARRGDETDAKSED